MPDAAKVQLLNRIGIDVWFARPSQSELQRRALEPSAPDETEVLPARVSARSPDRSAEKVPRDVAPSSNNLPEPPQSTTPDPVPVESFTLVCFRAADALLFCAPLASVNHRRLANDIAVSVSIAVREAPQKAEILEFRYPQIAGGAGGDWRRTLKAFTDKQVNVAAPKFIMVTRDVSHRFEGWYDNDPLIIDPVADLASNPDLKKALWQQIKSRLNRPG